MGTSSTKVPSWQGQVSRWLWIGSHKVLKTLGPKVLALVLAEFEKGKNKLARLHSNGHWPLARSHLSTQGVHKVEKRKRKRTKARRMQWQRQYRKWGKNRKTVRDPKGTLSPLPGFEDQSKTEAGSLPPPPPPALSSGGSKSHHRINRKGREKNSPLNLKSNT